MNTSTPSPLLESNVSVDSKPSSAGVIGFLSSDMGSKQYPAVTTTTNNNTTPENINKTSPYLPVSQLTTTSATITRKLIRTDSTYEDDSFDESISVSRDFSHLNHRHVLRQQWFSRKNNFISRLRRSTSTASNSSTSSSGISSNIYSSCNATNTSSSFASSFSSSFSATLSSLSESCDNSDSNISPQIITLSNENDYPKILRKSSFKNKFIHCYKPYYKPPRRLSLQLLKNNLELPENLKLYSTTVNFCHPRSSMKYLTCYTIGNKDKRFLYTMAVTSAASAKSNPSSPNKNMSYLGTGSHVSNLSTHSMNTTQVVIDSCSETGLNLQQGNIISGVNLIRSKSLDDLNTLFCCPNLCTSSCLGDTEDIEPMNNNTTSLYQQTNNSSISHYSSFNRICDCPKATVQQQAGNNNNVEPLGPTTYFSNHHLDPNINNTMDHFNLLNGNNLKHGINISSNQNNNNNDNNNHHNNVDNSALQHQQASNVNAPRQQQPPPPPTNNNFLCDIDHVMKKISSLRV